MERPLPRREKPFRMFADRMLQQSPYLTSAIFRTSRKAFAEIFRYFPDRCFFKAFNRRPYALFQTYI